MSGRSGTLARAKRKALIEVFGVIFPIPDRPGYWTEPQGRYAARADAKRYAGRTGQVVILPLYPGERPACRAGSPLPAVIKRALKILREMEAKET